MCIGLQVTTCILSLKENGDLCMSSFIRNYQRSSKVTVLVCVLIISMNIKHSSFILPNTSYFLASARSRPLNFQKPPFVSPKSDSLPLLPLLYSQRILQYPEWFLRCLLFLHSQISWLHEFASSSLS